MAKGRLYFDMDGTLADLYGVPDWLKQIEQEKEGLYLNAKPLVPMERLIALCRILQELGYEINIISWLPKNATVEYKRQVKKEKKEWLRVYFPIVNNIKIIDYGVRKQLCAKKGMAILFDDNEKVRSQWETPKDRKAVSNKDIFKEILNLLLTELA